MSLNIENEHVHALAKEAASRMGRTQTSVLVALLKNEAEASGFVDQMLAATSVCLSAASYLETGIVLDRTDDPILTRRLDDLLLDLGVDGVDATAGQARIARQAYRDYGEGQRPACWQLRRLPQLCLGCRHEGTVARQGG